MKDILGIHYIKHGIQVIASIIYLNHLCVENLVDIAQSKSELYSPTGSTAPPLKKEKSIKIQGLGKGWFDLKVVP